MVKYRLTRGFLLCCTLLAGTLYLLLSPRSITSASRSSTSTALAQHGKVTVLLSAYRTTGLRPQWIHDTAALYSSPPFRHIVDKVILVWNEPSAPPPRMPKRVQVIKGKVNSMNNRWTLSLPFIRTDAVLVLDDDIAVSLPALTCLLSLLLEHPDRLIGPFARRRDPQTNEYILNELLTLPGEGSRYNIVLPRVMMLSVGFLAAYGEQEVGLEGLRKYVDEQEAHCDDILLNAIAGYITGKPPLRIALPPSSVTDYTAVCGPLDRSLTSGLADQGSRWDLRTECMRRIIGGESSDRLSLSHSSTEVAVCSSDGSTYEITNKVPLSRWRSMATLTAKDLCPDLLKLDSALYVSPSLSNRSPLGQQVEEYCPAVNQAMGEWISALEELPVCEGRDGGRAVGRALREKGMVERLVESAKHQCGSWCIWDLRTSSRSGWYLLKSGPSSSLQGCFDRFEEGDGVYRACDGWWWQRPRVLLDGTEGE
ncbi:glycosyl transferase family 64 domain-domain-containing protein [Leucosporidium creatinivorum]|uniref:Glycosyl transferase family 64 domain-domain-containing protein n=1 Tax=Leucosporidium creatinivorum TaxID=106004 RepID=A0A1Y2FCC3_9BASI|nr:glycosyl transferase family 64 domain-domain-containing protein [Leucosporidium creatinivorum]